MIAEYLKSGSYERRLRHIRNALKNQVSNMALALARYFPPGTRLSTPQGGLVLWVRLHPKVDGLEVFYEALKDKISIFPGIVFSSTPAYKSYIRVSCGFPWSDRLEHGVCILGKIVKQMVAES